MSRIRKRLKNNKYITPLNTEKKDSQILHQKQETQTNHTFHIHGKRLFLTYSKVDKEINAQDLLYLLQNKMQLGKFEYIIARKTHCDGGIHFHAILIHNKKFQIRKKNILFIQFKGIDFHGNYQSVRFFSKTVEYVCKDKDYRSNIIYLQDGRILDHKDILIQRAKQIGIQIPLNEYPTKYPKKALSSICSLEKNFQKIQQIQDQIEDDLLE